MITPKELAQRQTELGNPMSEMDVIREFVQRNLFQHDNGKYDSIQCERVFSKDGKIRTLTDTSIIRTMSGSTCKKTGCRI